MVRLNFFIYPFSGFLSMLNINVGDQLNSQKLLQSSSSHLQWFSRLWAALVQNYPINLGVLEFTEIMIELMLYNSVHHLLRMLDGQLTPILEASAGQPRI
jgi:hypothetical protein